jgi:hypothetical protein
MPQVTVYVRQEDMAAWRAIEKKSEFISQALNPPPPKSHIKQPIPETKNNFQTENSNFQTELTKPEILADINRLEAERDEKLEHCQDPQEATKIGNRYNAETQSLWDKYHLITNEQ